MPTVGHRYWRLYIESGNSGNISANSIQFRETAGGPNAATGGTATASSTYSGYSIAAAFAGTGPYASNGGAPQWVAYDFGPGNLVNITEVAWQSRTDGYTEQTPNVVDLQYSDDGITYVQQGLSYGFGAQSAWAVGETKLFEVTYPPPLSTSKLGQYVVEGAPSIPQAVSKLGEYVVEGSAQSLFASKLGQYVVEGPPLSSNHSQAMLGTF